MADRESEGEHRGEVQTQRKYGMQRRVKEYGGKGCIGNTEGDARRGMKSSIGYIGNALGNREQEARQREYGGGFKE